jgi:hypothetical protein
MRLFSLATVVLSLLLQAPPASAVETQSAASKREKEMIAMQLEYSRIAGMKSIVDHLASGSLQCETVADCVSMPMGSRACGGPTSFVVTSNMNPSLEAVAASVALVTQAEKDANLKFPVFSICSIKTPPPLACDNNLCTGAL